MWLLYVARDVKTKRTRAAKKCYDYIKERERSRKRGITADLASAYAHVRTRSERRGNTVDVYVKRAGDVETERVVGKSGAAASRKEMGRQFRKRESSI